MASLVVSGDTSGAITIAAPAVAGTNTLTLPASTGTLVVTGGAQTVQFAAGTVSAPSITFTGDTNTGIFSPAADTIAFTEGGAEAMRIDSSGQVGIGITSPTSILHISSASQPYLKILYAAQREYSLTVTGSATTDGLAIRDESGSLEIARFCRSGNVGIGTSSFPSDTNLTVLGNFNSGFYRNVTSGNRGYFLNIGAKTSTGFADGGYIFGAIDSGDATGYLAFGTRSGSATAERMRITSGGALCVGGTSSYSDGILDVQSSQNNNIFGVRASSATFASSVGIFYADRNTTNNTFYALGYYNVGASAYKWRVADSGNVTNTNGSYGTISDAKLKENIVDATSKLDKVNQLKVRNYNFIGDELKQIGFVAQEFEQVFPSMVEESADKDKDGNDLGTTTKTIKTTVLIPILVKAIQEQQQIINDLKARIETLENT